MGEIAKQVPDDLDVLVLASEALTIDTPVGPNWAHPHNGWSLFGHAKATGDKAIEAEFDKAWARSDVKLTASVY